MKKKIIWLFGENEGKTANNNSFYFWDQVVTKKDAIEKYFVLIKNKKNVKFYKSLSSEKRKFIVWKNSIKHLKLYMRSDMFLVSLSYLDVIPRRIGIFKVRFGVRRPVIYLQHGTLAIKKINYTGKSYNNNFFRFVIYNKKIKETYIRENCFKNYQIYDGDYHPRAKALIDKNDKVNKKELNQILYYMTWREYFGENKETDKFLKQVKKLFENKILNKYLQENNLTLKVCLHPFFDKKKQNYLKENVSCDNIEIVAHSSIDVMDELVKSKLLITDYSSIGFEFTLINKPVILFTPDLQNYLKKRKLYCSLDELRKHSVQTVKDLVNVITSGNYKLNSFFRSRMPKKIDYDVIRNGEHIEKMYEDFKKYSLNKITFLGYNYHGRGGTVSATKSLAEALLEKGYLVEFLTLKKQKHNRSELPYGINCRTICIKSKKNIFKNIFYMTNKNYLYFKYDSSRHSLPPYVGTALKKYLENTTSKTVVSTRESIHPFLSDVKNDNIENKVYFFHTDAEILDNVFPKLLPVLQKNKYQNALFVSENSYKKYKNKYNLNIKKYGIIGNSIESCKTLDRNLIIPVKKKKVYNGIVLTRLSDDRKNDIDSIIEFGIYLKKNKVNNIVIDVYGIGTYVDKFLASIKKNKISKYINYCGLTDSPHLEIRNHDFLVDFSYNQTFGMIYIEGILNGKKVFARRNSGSLEVLKDINDIFYENNEELVSKINKVHTIKKEELINNYDKIMEKYSRSVIADKFIDVLK